MRGSAFDRRRVLIEDRAVGCCQSHPSGARAVRIIAGTHSDVVAKLDVAAVAEDSRVDIAVARHVDALRQHEIVMRLEDLMRGADRCVELNVVRDDAQARCEQVRLARIGRLRQRNSATEVDDVSVRVVRGFAGNCQSFNAGRVVIHGLAAIEHDIAAEHERHAGNGLLGMNLVKDTGGIGNGVSARSLRAGRAAHCDVVLIVTPLIAHGDRSIGEVFEIDDVIVLPEQDVGDGLPTDSNAVVFAR